MSETKTCRDCGAEFARSRADVTVRCPACRKARRGDASEAPRQGMSPEANAARSRAWKARREHGLDSPEYREAEAEFLRLRR
jgi:uncharacterized Zn finger protein (UPF0148 family)